MTTPIDKLFIQGMTDAEVAGICNVSVPCIKRWRNGDFAPGGLRQKKALAYLDDPYDIPPPKVTGAEAQRLNPGPDPQVEVAGKDKTPEAFDFWVTCETEAQAEKVRNALNFVKANFLES